MSGLVMHIVFFLCAAFAIVTMGAFYSHPGDAAAFRTIPRRYVVFVLSCGGVAVAMLLLEALFV